MAAVPQEDHSKAPNSPILLIPLEEAPPLIEEKHQRESGVEPRRGVTLDITRRIAEKMGWQTQYKTCSFNDCLQMMETGDLDFMGLLYRGKTRERYLRYLEPPIHTEQIHFFHLPGKSITINRYEDLAKYRIGTITGVKYFEPFDSDKHLRKFVVDSEIQRFKMLLSGRVDVVLSEPWYFSTIVEYLGLEDSFVRANFSTHGEDVYFTLSQRSSFLKYEQAITKVLKEMIDTGEVKGMFDEYGVLYVRPIERPLYR
ncbi:ABC transporter substrate-binding protein [Marinibactrum halimedae]|uniref:ABC transporter substrate-binding protein n=2 Tax=Marinibactrum halimedae TaxID=1444977 RepID=A0AA37T3I2_9GAMM|nr:ABC transporter substrate-binding protein [Marinibactrum halimedae]